MHIHIALDPNQLFHHIFIDMKAAGRIKDNHVHAVFGRVFHGCLGNVHWFVLITHGENRDSYLFSVDLQLFDGRGTVHIAGCQQRFPAFGLKLASNLGSGGGLTGTLKTSHHDNGNLIAGLKGNLRGLGTHKLDQFLSYNLHHGLSRRQAAEHILADRTFLKVIDELLHHAEAYVRFQKGHLDFLQRCLNICFGQSSFAAQVLKNIL